MNELPIVYSPDFGPRFWAKYLPLRIERASTMEGEEAAYVVYGIDMESNKYVTFEHTIREDERRYFAENAAAIQRNLADLFDAFGSGELDWIDEHTTTVAEQKERLAEIDAEIDAEDDDEDEAD